MIRLLVLVTGWILVCAADVKRSQKYNLHDNGMVATDTVFHISGVNAIVCSILCQQKDACEAFSFDEEICSGHHIWWTSGTNNRSASTAPLFVKEGPCSHHRVLDDYRRDVNYGVGELFDDGLTPGWYRFLLNGTDAVMTTDCLGSNHCGTFFAYWLDLKADELPKVGTEKAARACVWCHSTVCYYSTPVTVRNCGAFYVYHLLPVVPTGSSKAYCATILNN